MNENLPSHLQQLNERQLEAVKTVRGPVLVLAGAGSGKTRVLTRRVAHLVLDNEVRPEQILAVTFTNKAAKEMKDRLSSLLGDNSSGVWISTFHSSCLRILRRHANKLRYSNDFAIYDDQDQKSILKKILKQLEIDDKKYPVAFFRRYIDQCKNSAITPQKAAAEATDYVPMMQAEVYDRYQRALIEADAMDFGDLLLNTLLLFREHREVLARYQENFEYVLVDEFQDTNYVQYQFVRLLSAPQNNLFVVGDDDQSIYAFRGADISNILNFEKDFLGAKVVKLEQNYRSTGNILSGAHAVIEKNTERKEKKLWTESPAGEEIELFCGLDEHDEAEFISQKISEMLGPDSQDGLSVQGKDIAIFYRTNAQSRAIEEALMDQQIPYRIFGGLKFYERKEIKDILSYLRLVVNESDNQAFLRVVNTPPRGMGPQSIKQIADFAESRSISLLQAAEELPKKSKSLKLFLELIGELRERARRDRIYDLLHFLIERTEYLRRLEKSNDPNALSRAENVQELQALSTFLDDPSQNPLETLRGFLDRVSLSSSEETATNQSPAQQQKEPAAENYVSLMTLHLAKGLEYPIVFLTGFEEGLLPHYRSIEDPLGVSEERRLCYVGMTRAMRKLYISRARRRGMFSAGEGFAMNAGLRESSRFAFDISKECLGKGADSFFASPLGYDQSSEVILDEIFDDSFDVSNDKERLGALQSSGPQRPKRSRSKPSGPSALQSAESLMSRLPLASSDELTDGTRVFHPNFGEGIIEETKGDPNGDPRKFKVRVRFDNSEASKNLVYKFAKLSLANHLQ